jgi:hypothetical protein
VSRYRFELATPADDEDLRRVIAETAMPGRIQVAFRREPSFFAAAVVEGHATQVVAARDTTTGRIVGFGCRSLRNVYVNGQPRQVGYLSGLRLLAEHRSIGLVARGFAFFRQLHADGKAGFYLTTIAEDNRATMNVLLGGRAGLPRYHDFGRYLTAVVSTKRGRSNATGDVRPATEKELKDVLAFWQSQGPTRQFFPAYQTDDFRTDGALRGLAASDVLVARVDGAIVGTLALWDQRPFRQIIVAGYDGVIRAVRPWYNAWAAIRGAPRLPPRGSTVDCLVAAALVVIEGRQDIVAALFDRALAVAAQRGVSRVSIGLHESDPLLATVRRYPARWYATRLFLACWEDGETEIAALDQRPKYLELGSL